MIGTNNNTSSILQSERFLRLNQLRQQRSFQRLATGRRINSGRDDPAGLIAAESLSSSLAALEAEARVTQRASSIAAVAEGALAETSTLLVEAKRLAVANADGTLSQSERDANQAQIDSIVASVNRISNTTNFNGTKLLDGNYTLSISGDGGTQDGAGVIGGRQINLDSSGAGVIGGRQINGTSYTLADVTTGGDLAASANRGADTVAVVDQAISDIATQRAKVGAFSRNVLDTRINSLSVATENLSAARSAIQDTDYAAETARRFRSELLGRAGVSAFKSTMKTQRRLLNLLG